MYTSRLYLHHISHAVPFHAVGDYAHPSLFPTVMAQVSARFKMYVLEMKTITIQVVYVLFASIVRQYQKTTNQVRV